VFDVEPLSRGRAMRLQWTQQLPTGQSVECRLPWWYPWALRVMGFGYALRGRYPDDAVLVRLRQRCLRVRRLPDGAWQRWRDFDADHDGPRAP
jgi:hypothetical protein